MSEFQSPRGDGISPRGLNAEGPVKEILSRIEKKGPMTFAEFMYLALYWHDGGYYASMHERWGGGGDYITSIDVSPVFARTIARQVREMWEAAGRPPDFELIEAGAGRGWLSKGVLEACKNLHPELYGVIKIRLVEKNPFLKEKPKDNITWHEDIEELGGSGGITGCILSNELIDSFPVHRVIYRNGLKELYVGCDGTSFVDVPGEPSTPELPEYFRRLGIELADGQRAEVNLKAPEWIKKAAGLLKAGFIITIDYGLPARELYAPERMAGSLHCHFRHTLNDNPYINIGLQDITTHVDFTTLASSGIAAGLLVSGFTTQKNFLLGLGILEELKEAASIDLANYDKIKYNREISRLITPGGMGDTFKVLIHRKGVEKTALSGFSFKDMTSYLRIV